MNAHIRSGGLLTTVQDLGRVGRRRDGIPMSGAMDRTALSVANLLVGNLESAAALECTLIGPAMQFDAPALVAIAGANLHPTIDDAPVPCWHALRIPAGATLSVGTHGEGCRAYVAVAGGVDVPTVFGSRATYLRASFGGFEGRALRTGDVLPIGTPTTLGIAIAASLTERAERVAVARWTIGVPIRPRYSDDTVVRVVDGTQTEALAPESIERLCGERFRVASSSDRMGYRLEGPPLALRAPIEMLSEAVAFGTIQLPPGGAPIVLMADGQTTGGYPRVGQVATIDLPLVAQLRPGDHVRFRRISLADAQHLYLAHVADLAEARRGLTLRFMRGQS